jgi:hypothetical protein
MPGVPIPKEERMTTATQAGQAGLQGWREKVADTFAEPVANRTKLDEDQVRALIGAAFFVLAVVYVANTIRALVRQ